MDHKIFTRIETDTILWSLHKFIQQHIHHENTVAQFINDIDDDRDDFKTRTMRELGVSAIYKISDFDHEQEPEEFQEREEGDERIDLLDARGYQIVLEHEPSEFFARLVRKIKNGDDLELTASVRNWLVKHKHMRGTQPGVLASALAAAGIRLRYAT